VPNSERLEAIDTTRRMNHPEKVGTGYRITEIPIMLKKTANIFFELIERVGTQIGSYPKRKVFIGRFFQSMNQIPSSML
jgi:hypothetical protein